MKKHLKSARWLTLLAAAVLVIGACHGKRLTKANVDEVSNGMSQKEVESILGPPTSQQQRQTLKFENGQTRWDPEVLYKYEDGKKSATITLKDDKVSAKDPTIQGGP